MTPSLGVNLRVTGHCNQGGRKYMEDVFSVAYQQTNDEKDLEYAFFGIFDGHGGREAAQYSKDHLMDAITKNKLFWSEEDDSVLKAIREGFLSTQQAMWNELPNWRKTATGLPSTAGTTASICFIKRGKLFIGHVGDSGIILGERDPTHPSRWRAKPLTREHKPESEEELARIEEAGGKVMTKSGVHRVVWYRPSNGANHQGPVRRSTHFDEVPFLAVARALGDLWSYNSKKDVFVVSPDPDLRVFDLNVLKDRCLVLATDGAWNVLSPEMAIEEVFAAERNNEKHMIDPQGGHTWVNPSKRIVDIALDRWKSFKLRADNTSIVTVMLDPPGPPRAQVLRRLYGVQSPKNISRLTSITDNDPEHISKPIQDLPKTQTADKCEMTKIQDSLMNSAMKNNVSAPANADQNKIQKNDANKDDAEAVAIISRFPNSKRDEDQLGHNIVITEGTNKNAIKTGELNNAARIVHDSIKTVPSKIRVAPPNIPSYLVHPPPPPRDAIRNTSTNQTVASERYKKSTNSKENASDFEEQTPSSTSNLDTQACLSQKGPKLQPSRNEISSPLQINQVTSSDDESTPPPLPQRPPGGHGALNKRRSLCRELADLQNNASSMISGAGDNTPSKNCNVGRNTRSGTGTNTMPKDQSCSGVLKHNNASAFPSVTIDNVEVPRKENLISKKLPRRSVVLPPGEESPAYNSDSENHHPGAIQLRSRVPRRSTSVPHKRGGEDITTNSPLQVRSSSNVARKKSSEHNALENLSSLPAYGNGSHNCIPSSKVKQMAVSIENRNTLISQQPPPLPARKATSFSVDPKKVLRPNNLPGTKKSTDDSRSLPTKPTEASPKNSSPRILRSRNTPSTSYNGHHQPGTTNNSKVISTPNNRVPFYKDNRKSVPSRTTERSVRFFEDGTKSSNETGVKRKRRSFDISAHSMPISKSAKLIRTAHSTRSCTWVQQTSVNKSKTAFSNSLCSKRQLTNNSKSTPTNRRSLKS